MFSSPLLQEPGDEMLTECPVGYVLREAPHIYDLLDYLSLSESLSPLELGRMPRYFGQMLRVYQNELVRVQDLAYRQRAAEQSAEAAKRAIRHGHS
jgi:hypothetical protein